jgi:hypothetical protein
MIRDRNKANPMRLGGVLGGKESPPRPNASSGEYGRTAAI